MSMPLPTPGARRRISRKLLRWFAAHARLLPWRASRDPYAIWVSEIMLQQTQAATVVRYFERFLRDFPDVAALAAAAEQQVLRCWEGLGYYRRARDLHSAARLLVARHGGKIPNDPDTLRQLPGFGRYTVGAVLSQAFNRRLPIVETNSRRVLCRVFGIRAGPAAGDEHLWKLAERLLPDNAAGDFNQALMELGALVCKPRQPDCRHCPLQPDCLAHRDGLQEAIPPPRKRAAPTKQVEVAIVCQRGQRLLVVQRPDAGRWPGMWEFPHGPRQPRESIVDAGRRVLQERTGCRADIGKRFMDFAHGITRYRIRLIGLQARWRGGVFASPFYQQARWLHLHELGALPFSAPQRRLAGALPSYANLPKWKRHAKRIR